MSESPVHADKAGKKSAGELQRGLSNRHIQLIALGGAVGTGLFLGAGSAIFAAGPAVILGYAIAGLMSFLIIRQLGDMTAEEPVAGSFSYFAQKYWGDFPGFLAGWNYWILYVVVGISELTAAAAYMHYWWPGVPSWVTALVFFVVINAINMAAVKAYGEMEFWFALIKLATIGLMIVLGLYILLFDSGLIDGASFSNLWLAPSTGAHAGDPAYAGFLPHGINGLIFALPIIMFAFGGLELVGITSAEATNPQKTIPKACNQVIWRILILYIGTMVILLSLYHWSSLSPNESPFVMVFDKAGFTAAAGFINFVVLTASLSVYNCCVYSTSRMLYSLALQNSAPKLFTRTDKRGVPYTAIGAAGLLTFLVVPLNYLVPAVHDAFNLVMSVVVAGIVLNWAMISLAHLFFARRKRLEGHKTVFPSPLFPASNYLCLGWVIFVLVAMFFLLGMKGAVIALPVWVGIVYAGYRLAKLRR